MSPRIPIIYSTAIYGGGHHLGDVAKLATGQYAAFDPTGRLLGVFDHRADAELAAWNNTVVLHEHRPRPARHLQGLEGGRTLDQRGAAYAESGAP